MLKSAAKICGLNVPSEKLTDDKFLQAVKCVLDKIGDIMKKDGDELEKLTAVYSSMEEAKPPSEGL